MKNEKRNASEISLMNIRVFCFLFSVFCFPLLCGCGKNSSPKFTQYYVQGEKLYLKHCNNCHQADGTGLGRVYPPLNISDYMENNFADVICLMRHGKTDEVIVNGQQFNQPMQGVTTLSDLEIAEIATYIYNTWTHDRGIVEVKEAAEILGNCNP
ncbi:MAG: cytochrome c [Cyclobacteriaceae bacterium]